MKIAIVAPSIYMSEKTYPERIFAPRIVALQITEGLAEKGHEVTLFSAPDINTKARLVGGAQDLLKGDLIRDKFLNRELLTEYKLQSSIESQTFYSLDLIGMAFREGLNSSFDIIQTDDPLIHSLVELLDFPVVFTFHDPLPQAQSLDFWFLNRYKRHNFISISMAQRRGQPSLNFVGNVYHGLDPKSYQASFEKGTHLAYFGRLLVQKGPDIAIKAARETGETIKIASDKTHFNTEFVKKNILPFIDGNTIQHVGFFINTVDKSNFLNQAKALMMPVLWDEAFGLVMIEAMVCGTPVIAYNRGSVSEIVRDGLTGFIIDQDNEDRPGKGTWVIKKQGIEGLVEAIKRIGEIDRKACRKHVEKNFSVSRMVDGYEKVYSQIVNKYN